MSHSKFKDKQFWIKEVKSINLTDVLIWISIILMFLASWQNISAGKDPCSYCIIQNDPVHGDITCKDYFDNTINSSSLILTNGNISIGDTR